MPFSTPIAPRLARLIVAERRWVFLAMLLALHAALIAEPGVYQRLWLLVHFGLFLLWQPLFATERELDVFPMLLLVAITIATLYFLSGWMIVMWLLVLIGILGGRVFTIKAARRNRFYLVAFAYVLTILLLWSVPALILGAQEIPDSVKLFAQRVVPLALALLLVLPMPKEDDSGQVFDFFYAVLVFQLGVVLVLGSIVAMRFTNEDYVTSVALTVLGFGLALFVFAVLWNPMRGFGGLRTYFSTYLMSVGMPFELWMRRIAELAETETDPRRFLENALREIALLPWMRGGHWRSPDGEGHFGDESGHATRFVYQGLEVVFHTEIRLSPALFLHMRLLAQVVGEFYEGKRRENALRQHSYLQAVHETGARLTHDVKNLLQSLYAITSMAPKESADGYAGLLQRQLPQLTKRLHATLEKLRSPEVAASELPVRATAWWREIDRRLAGSDITLEARIAADGNIPAALFDSFVENALDNARAKLAREPAIGIVMKFVFDAERIELTVSDSGSAVPEAIAQRLFAEPVERGGGMGIGLYHVARLAAQASYRIELRANRDCEVSFTLVRDESTQQ
ncbi:MAG: ATP-binding protein [Usitatibacter sp.]